MARARPARRRWRVVASAPALFFFLTAAAGPVVAQPLRLDAGPGGVPGDALAVLPVISADGRYTAFLSAASNLVPGDTDGSSDFFRYDRETGLLARGDIVLNVAGNSEETWPGIGRAAEDFLAHVFAMVNA